MSRVPKAISAAVQSVLSTVYPAQCVGCREILTGEAALCPVCWPNMPFILGSACRTCGAPLPGEAPGDDLAICDECSAHPRSWVSGSAAAAYGGVARRLVMGLKHGDRQELVQPIARWIAASLSFVPGQGDIIVPVPIHWSRMMKRKFNQSVLVANALADLVPGRAVPDGLIRLRATQPQEDVTRAERFTRQAGSIAPNPRRSRDFDGVGVLLIDDVMTTGATLSAATSAAYAAGAGSVHVATFARVVRQV